jgi:glutathione S-transferase
LLTTLLEFGEFPPDLISNLFSHFLPSFFENCERMLKERGGKTFVGGEDVTYGEICVFQVLRSFTDPDDPFYSTLPGVGGRLDMLDYHPLLKALMERVGEMKGIKKWMDSRPKGLF